ncbi:hypothetical protein CLCR_04424 [Cladophialophora carrionii]|uniref:Uncharacterized protein n=1 Tax=Cladophialophora carrionii TaxID=86049 RepID=A0A1C1CHZ2_9EURO|nr:hypothetical protein CLCR_04424 [Cladophialophora carrionii]
MSRNTADAEDSPDFDLALGAWHFERVPRSLALGTCVTLNNNTAYGTVAEPEYCSVCAENFGPATYIVSQLSNGSYALAGTVPIEFANELAFLPSQTQFPWYQWQIPFITTAGTCEVSFIVQVSLGRMKDEYQIRT